MHPLSNTRVTASLLLILLVGAGLRVYGHQNLWGTDDAEYARLANAMAVGNFREFVQQNYLDSFNAPAHLPGRVGMVVPLAVLFRVGGVNDVTLALYPFLTSVGTILLAFFMGRLLFGPTAGLIAAALWAVLPNDIDGATAFLPDGIANFYASLGVLLLLVFLVKRIDRSSTRLVGGLLAGLCFGVSWLTKESIAYLVPFAGLLLMVDARRAWKSAIPLWVGVAIASGAILLTEMTVYHLTRGDALLRLHEVERSDVQAQSYLFYEGSRFGWPVGGSHLKALVKRLALDGPRVILMSPEFLFLPLFGVLASAYAVYRRDRSFLFPALWLGSLAFMYNFMSASFTTYTPLVLYQRYLLPLALPAILLTAGLIVKLLFEASPDAVEKSERVFWGWTVAVLIVGVSGYGVFRKERGLAAIRSSIDLAAVGRVVRPDDRIYTDPLSHKWLEFQWRYPSTSGYVDFEGMTADEVKPGSYVLVDARRLDWLQTNVSMWLTSDYGFHRPSFADEAPPTWETVWRNGSTVLYHISG